MIDTNDYQARLRRIAESQSIPFCYACYVSAPTGRCTRCWTDDLMRMVPGVGVEWGLEWVVSHVLASQLEAVDVDAAFEECITDVYPETVQIGWVKYDTVSAIKALDPVSWDVAKSEWVDAELVDGTLITFDNGGAYYRTSDLDHFVETHCNEDERR